jgi:hypothetical protein
MQDVKTDTINIKQAQISPNQVKNNKYTQKNNFFQKILKARELESKRIVSVFVCYFYRNFTIDINT